MLSGKLCCYSSLKYKVQNQLYRLCSQLKCNYEPISFHLHCLISKQKCCVAIHVCSNREHDRSDMTWRMHLFRLWNGFSTFTVPKTGFSCGLLSGIRVEVTMFTDDANVLAFPSSGKVYWFSLYVENIWTSSA